MDILRSINQVIKVPGSNILLAVKREDLIHPFVSGNKYRKLKYNIEEAKRLQKKTLLTFGGAFSNHIVAVAAAGNFSGFNTIGIIRGEELRDKVISNPSLQRAEAFGMQLEFIDRETYRNKETPTFIEGLHLQFGDFYLIPEGGTNDLAVKGCAEILNIEDKQYDFVCCAVGTGGTIAGLINSATYQQQLLGFPALKGVDLNQEICRFAHNDRFKLIRDYHFGGYGKINEELVRFINSFRHETGILLDPVYTGKMMFGIYDLIQKGYFPKGSSVLAIHTGGLQGIQGMNLQLANKHLPLIDTDD